MFKNFFSKNRTVYDIMSQTTVEAEEPQMTSQYSEYALHAGKAKLHARTRVNTSMRPGKNTHAQTNQ
jgi:hypothetical protein